MTYVPNLKYKTALCENYIQNKNCLKGTLCHFAHGQSQLRSIADNQRIISQQNSYFKVMAQQNIFPSNYKTIKCKFYEKGKCELGDNCTFIHQKSQRRPKPQIQNIGYYNTLPNYGYQGTQGIQYFQGGYQQYYVNQYVYDNYQVEKFEEFQHLTNYKNVGGSQNSQNNQINQGQQIEQKSKQEK